MCFGCHSRSPELLQTFQDAQSAFEAENYRQSAALYETLLDQGIRSGNIYFNLGNAWAKADDPVRAVAAYYHAKRYIPNDSHLNANLRSVLTKKGGTLPSSDHSFIGLLFFWQDTVGYNTKIGSSLFLVALTFFGSVLCLFCRSHWLKRFTVAGAILTIIALSSVGYDWYRFEWIEQVIVSAEALPRKGNSEQYEPAFVSPIPFGTIAMILDKRSGWYSLRFPNGQDGWLAEPQVFLLQGVKN